MQVKKRKKVPPIETEGKGTFPIEGLYNTATAGARCLL